MTLLGDIYMTKIVMESVLSDVDYEDGGSAVIVNADWETQGADESIFVRIQSWDDDVWEHPNESERLSTIERAQLGHKSIHELIGKRVRVTIEVIDEE